MTSEELLLCLSKPAVIIHYKPGIPKNLGLNENRFKRSFLGTKQLRGVICVSLDCQAVLSETENAFLTAVLEIGPKDLPKYILYQSFAAVSPARECFFFLQCSARGAIPYSAAVPPTSHDRLRWAGRGSPNTANVSILTRIE